MGAGRLPDAGVGGGDTGRDDARRLRKGWPRPASRGGNPTGVQQGRTGLFVSRWPVRPAVDDGLDAPVDAKAPQKDQRGHVVPFQPSGPCRERDRQRDRKERTETARERDRERQRDREIQRGTERQRDRETERERAGKRVRPMTACETKASHQQNGFSARLNNGAIWPADANTCLCWPCRAKCSCRSTQHYRIVCNGTIVR